MNQVKFIPGMQDLLNIEKFINITYYINKPEEKNHDPLHRCSEN